MSELSNLSRTTAHVEGQAREIMRGYGLSESDITALIQSRPMTRDEATCIVRAIFRRCGYAVGEHGTRGKDLDLVAVPWTEQAGQPHLIVDQVVEAIDGIVTLPARRDEKPHGRLAWAIRPLHHAPHDHWYVDLSVMPPVGYELPDVEQSDS